MNEVVLRSLNLGGINVRLWYLEVCTLEGNLIEKLPAQPGSLRVQEINCSTSRPKWHELTHQFHLFVVVSSGHAVILLLTVSINHNKYLGNLDNTCPNCLGVSGCQTVTDTLGVH